MCDRGRMRLSGGYGLLAGLCVGCAVQHAPAGDSGLPEDSARADAAPRDAAGGVCGCSTGPHSANVYVLSDEAALYAFDPVARTFAYVLGPVCPTTERPYSMAIDPQGRAWILFSETRRIQVFDILAPAACSDSGFLPTSPDFPLFGMGFVSPHADAECASLFIHSYSGSGPFREGPGLGRLGVVSGSPLAPRTLAPTDHDGAEVSGTGDGRLFSFGGVSPAKLTEYDRSTGAVLETVPLTGLPRTNASAFAFFAGDFYFFTEALPRDCDGCFETECPTAWSICQADVGCAEQVACAIEAGHVTDACGGGAGAEMLACLSTCSEPCLTSARARVSQVTRLDWDGSDGAGRALTVEVEEAPIRVVGAGTSPCVPTAPF